MNRYLSLLSWTDKGVRAFDESVDRAEAAARSWEAFGGRMVDVWWLLGPWDLAVLSEFPDDESATAALLRVGAAGNIRTTTMRAFDGDAMRSIIAKATG